MKSSFRRRVYLLVCMLVLVLWLRLGGFDAIEAPYVRF